MAQIAVIIPVYNCQKYIKKCVESVLNQVYTDWELILVDDGSTDGSGEICDYYMETDERVKVLHKENGGGAGEARNAGVDAAKSPFLVFLDSDDYLHSESLSTLYKTQQQGDYDVVVSGYVEYVEGVEKGKCTNSVYYEPQVLPNKKAVRSFFVEHYPEGLLGFPWNKLYKAEIIKRASIKFPKMRRLEDGIFNVEYFENCESCVILKETLYYYKNSEQVELRKLPYDFYDIMEMFVKHYYTTIKKWNFQREKYEKSIIAYFQNDFVCCIENILQPTWDKSYFEHRSYLKDLRNETLVEYMLARPCESGRYTKIVLFLYKNRWYTGVFFITFFKRIMKTKFGKLFYGLKKAVN